MSATFAPSRRLAGHTFFWPVAVFLALLLFAFQAFAGQAILSWTGVQDSRVTGYNVHYGLTSGTYTSTYAAGNATSATVTGLTDGQTYYFVVRARDAAGTESANSNQVSKTIPAATPTATISAAPTSGTAPLAVTFAVKSTSASSYTWNFGDNTTSTSSNPTHTYTNTTTQPVTYTASLSSGSAVMATQTITVNPSSSSGSSGSSTNTTSQAPNGTILSPSGGTTVATRTRVQFASSGTGANQPLSYSWDFGDGGTSTSQNPRHRYYTAGSYVAKLTVKDAKGNADPTPATVSICVGTCTSSASTSTSTSSSSSSSSSTSASTPTPTPTAATQTIWPASATPSNPSDSDTASVNLGVKFTSSQSGYIYGIRFYKSTANTGTHVGTLWSSSGQKLATATFTNETASGWQQVNFATPVAITANTVYVASYFAPNGHYANDDNYFASNGVDSGPLHALSKPESGGNGVYVYSATSAFPNTRYQATNYWVDVVFRAAN